MSKKILVVEDEEALLKLYKSMLEADGHEVTAVKTGLEALDLTKGGTFDLMFLDIMLPDIRGDKIVEEMRGRDDDTTVVLITGFPELQSGIDALDLGINEILIKPIKVEELLRVANEALSS
jgi:DNA-binding response OmpR family regulator